MLTILMYMTARQGKEQAFHDLALRLTAVTRDEDDGCLAYTFHRQRDNPREYVLYEQWRDVEALRAHLDHLQRLLGPPAPGSQLPAAIFDLCENTKSVGYEVIA